MIKEYIGDIHTKPDRERKRIVYGASAIITLLIGFVWFTSFGFFNNSNVTGDVIADNSSTTNGPLTILGSNISNAFDAFRGAVGIKVASKSTYSNGNATASLEYIPD